MVIVCNINTCDAFECVFTFPQSVCQSQLVQCGCWSEKKSWVVEIVLAHLGFWSSWTSLILTYYYNINAVRMAWELIYLWKKGWKAVPESQGTYIPVGEGLKSSPWIPENGRPLWLTPSLYSTSIRGTPWVGCHPTASYPCSSSTEFCQSIRHLPVGFHTPKWREVVLQKRK